MNQPNIGVSSANYVVGVTVEDVTDDDAFIFMATANTVHILPPNLVDDIEN